MHFDNDYTLSVPKFKDGLIKVDLTLAKNAEHRMHEAAYVNRSTAQELMAVFVKAYTDIRDNMVRIRHEYTQTINAIEVRKSILILDVCPVEAVKRGIATKASPSGSEDFRNSIVVSDKEYQRLTELSNVLKATYEFLSNKAEAFKMTYQQIKKVYVNDDLEDHGLRNESLGVDGIGSSRY